MDHRLYFLLTRAQRRMADAATAGLADLGVTPTQAGALFAIRPGEGITINALAQALDLAQSAASGLAQRLERLGLLERDVDPVDARTRCLRLSPRARSVRTQALQRTHAFNQAMAGDLSPAELEIVARWLNSLTISIPQRQTQ